MLQLFCIPLLLVEWRANSCTQGGLCVYEKGTTRCLLRYVLLQFLIFERKRVNQTQGIDSLSVIENSFTLKWCRMNPGYFCVFPVQYFYRSNHYGVNDLWYNIGCDKPPFKMKYHKGVINRSES